MRTWDRIRQQDKLYAPLFLQYPRIVIGRILVHVADDLIAGLERITVGDEVDTLSRVTHVGNVVGCGLK